MADRKINRTACDERGDATWLALTPSMELGENFDMSVVDYWHSA